ncbi:MAG: succinate--CoA ligase subunit alpha [Acidimicrobiales bacterium]
MSIFVDETTKVVYQGLTGSQGRYYGLLNRDYGTQVVAGTNPRKAGTDVDGIPVFATVADAVEATGATASCIFIPAAGVKAAVMEAAEGGIEFIVCITEGVPAQDEAWFFNKLKRDFPGVQLLGPNCPGIISPGKCNIGITAGHIAKPGGPVGIVSRSGTLTYQALYELKLQDIGVTTCVGIGGDPVPGTSFIDCLEAFEADPETKAVMLIGEIGGSAEEEAAEFIKNKMSKPVSAYIAGVTAPAGKKMGHAGAIVSGGKGTAQGKMEALQAAGVRGPQPHRGRRAHGGHRPRARLVLTHVEAVLLVVLIVAYLAFIVGFYCFYALCYAKTFQKAGLPAWWGWVPVVNSWGMVQLAGRDVVWFVLMLIPCVNLVALVVVSMDVAKAFGKDPGWGLGLAFLGFVFWPMLAFGKSQYVGNLQQLAAYGYGLPGYGQQYPQQGYGHSGQQGYGQQYPPQGGPQQPQG